MGWLPLRFGISSRIYHTESNTTYGKKNNFNLKNARFVNHSIYTRYENLENMLISYVRLDHTLYSINYGKLYHTLAILQHPSRSALAAESSQPSLQSSSPLHSRSP